MNKVTCKQVGGVCEEVIEGENPSEIFSRLFMHIKETDDKEHQEIFTEMQDMTDDECAEWDQMICNACSQNRPEGV